jgi:hypothetical protein
LRTTIERQLLKDLRRGISLLPYIDIDNEWKQSVIKTSIIEESFLAEEKLPSGYQENPQKRKSNPAKGKKVATGSSRTMKGGKHNVGFKKHFQMPKDRFHFMTHKVKERKQKLREITKDTLRQR